MKGVKNITGPCSGGGGELVAALNKVVWQKLSAVFAQTHSWSSVVCTSLFCFVSFQVLEYVELELINIWWRGAGTQGSPGG